MSNQFDNTVDNLAQLKIFYQGPIQDQLSEDLVILRAAEKMKKGWSGSQVNRPLRVRRNMGIGANSDNGLLPNIGRQTTIQAVIAAKYNYLRFGVTGPMIKASASAAGAFVKAAEFELQNGYQDLSNDLNRQYSADGTGTMATVSANAVSSVTVSITGRTSVEQALKFLDVGMVVDFLTSAGTLVAQGLTITATTGAPTALSGTITVNAPVTTSSTDIIVRSGSYNKEIQGLVYSLDGATSGSIYSAMDRGLYPALQSNVIDASSAQLTLDRLQNAFNEGLRRGGVKDANYQGIYCDYDSLRYYQKLLTPDKRYVNTVQGDGSFGQKGKFYLDFNGVPVVQDKDTMVHFVFLPEGILENWVLCDMEFADETGSMYLHQVDTDAYEVRIRYFANLFNSKPSACARLKGYISP